MSTTTTTKRQPTPGAIEAARQWARDHYEEGGDFVQTTDQGAVRARASKRNADVDDVDIRAAELGTEAAAQKGKPLSQRIAAKEAKKAREVLAGMLAEQRNAGKFPNLPMGPLKTEVANVIPTVLGFSSERALRAYVDGRESTLKDDARAGVKTLTKGIASHQVWARKAAAAALGITLQAKEETR